MAKPLLPAFMLKHAGFRGRDPGSVEMPRLRIDGAGQPEFRHGLTDERLGPTVRVCAIYIDSRFVLWRPLPMGGGILARADDGKHWTPADTDFAVKLDDGREVTWKTAKTVKASGLDRRGSSNPSDPRSPPAADRIYAVVCAFPHRRDLPPAVLVLQGAAAKAATKLITELKAIRAPSFGVILAMAVSRGEPSSGGSHTITFGVVSPVEDRTLYEDHFAQYRMFMEHSLRIEDLEGAQDECGELRV